MIWVESDAEIPEHLMESTFPITVVYRHEPGLRLVYYRTKCLVCNTKKCKHFYYMKAKPMITPEGHFINKLISNEYMGVDPKYMELGYD